MAKGKGGGGFPGGVQDLSGQAKQMQSQLEEAHAQAQAHSEEGQSGGGMVKVVARGDNSIESITINPEVVDPEDIEVLQEMIMAAANSALKNVQEKVQGDLTKITGGMSIPGLF